MARGLEFFFDLDDTLIWNQYMYQMPYARAIDFILDRIDAPVKSREDMVKVMAEISRQGKTCKELGKIITSLDCDPIINEVYGFAWQFNLNSVKADPNNPFPKERFPTAMMETYFEMCNRRKKEPSTTEAKRAYDIGTGFWNVVPDMVDGAEETLLFLKEKGEKTFIFTAGDRWLQDKKIEVNGLDRLVNHSFVVPAKQNGIIGYYVEDKNRDSTYMVGNSMKSDINPATKAGIKAIYVPCKTWEYEDNSSMDCPEKVIVVDKISDIIEKYDSL